LAKNAKIILSRIMKESFAEYIKNKRVELGYTQTKLAAALEIDAASLSKIETGKKVLDENKLSILAKIFKVDLHTLNDEYVSEKIANTLLKYRSSERILELAEQKFKYFKSKKVKQATLNL
jgi:HTH-type transcriptional regulator, competence development regulator